MCLATVISNILNKKKYINCVKAALSPQRESIFTAKLGVSIIPLGFSIYSPNRDLTQNDWDNVITTARLDKLLAAGFDHVRIVFDPTDALNSICTNDLSKLDDVLKLAKYAIDFCLARNLKVIFDIHVQLDMAISTGWESINIEADYPSGRKWLSMEKATESFADLCGSYEASDVAYELWNENVNNNVESGSQNWPIRIKRIWEIARAKAPQTTLLVGGSFYSSISGLLDLDATCFDYNTGFVVHNYEPNIFTHQAAAGYSTYVNRLHYPPIVSEKSTSIAQMSRRVNLSPETAKSSIIKDRTRRLNLFFDVPQGCRYLDDRIEVINAWRASNGNIPAARIFISEFGVHNDYGTGFGTGATTICRAAWFQDMDSRNARSGFARTLWNYNSPDYWDVTKEDGTWDLRPEFVVALGAKSIGSYEDEALNLFRQMDIDLNYSHQSLISVVIKMLKDSNVWSKLEGFYFLAAHDEQSSLLNWTSNPRDLTKSIDVRYLRGRGFNSGRLIFNDVNLDKLLSPYTGSQHGTQSGHIGIWKDASSVQFDDVKLMLIDESCRLSIEGQTISFQGNDENQIDSIEVNGLAPGHLLANFVAGSELTGYYNGSRFAKRFMTKRAVSKSKKNQTIEINFGKTTSPNVSLVHFGSILSDHEARDLYTICRFFINGMKS